MASTTDVTMPQLGETVTEGTITNWTKKVGDTVEMDEVFFTVSTDKVDSEVPAPCAGTVSEILVAEGETVAVGTKLAVITAGAAGAASASATASSSASAPTSETASEIEPASDASGGISQGAQSEAKAVATPAHPGTSPSSADTGSQGKVLSPIVRKLINENGLDAQSIQGTGLGGRVTREDVEKLIASGRGSSSSSVSASSGSSIPRPAPMPVPAPGQRDTVIPFSTIRRKTAEHMLMSKATSAHTLVTVEVDYANVDKVRAASKSSFKNEEGFSLTYLPFIARALVDAIREFPYVNASVGANELIVHSDVNVGIAVDLDYEGLLVPVVKSADGLRMRQLARSIKDIASRARGKKLQADDISGGTITITNAGGYGTLITYPVISQPQVAIISTDGVKKKPVVIELPDGSDAIGIHPVGVLGLAWDHRAFDGAYAAAFMARVREILETRDWSSEL